MSVQLPRPASGCRPENLWPNVANTFSMPIIKILSNWNKKNLYRAAKRRCLVRDISWQNDAPVSVAGAPFDPAGSDRRSSFLFIRHNLVDPRFAPVGLCRARGRPGPGVPAPRPRGARPGSGLRKGVDGSGGRHPRLPSPPCQRRPRQGRNRAASGHGRRFRASLRSLGHASSRRGGRARMQAARPAIRRAAPNARRLKSDAGSALAGARGLVPFAGNLRKPAVALPSRGRSRDLPASPGLPDGRTHTRARRPNAEGGRSAGSARPDHAGKARSDAARRARPRLTWPRWLPSACRLARSPLPGTESCFSV